MQFQQGNNFASSFQTKWDWNSVTTFSDISKQTQQHLVTVYGTLGAMVLCAGIGVVADMKLALGGILSTIGLLGALIWLMSTSPQTHDPLQRMSILMTIGFLKGVSLGQLIATVIMIDPSILVTAFFGTVTVFAAFSASAIFCQRRSMLFLAGFLGSALSLMFTLSFINIFFGSTTIVLFNLYFGLLVFCGFVLFDTQLIIEKSERGNRDHVKHALELFIDFVQIFVRLLIILTKDNKRNNNRERDNRRR
eukprot:GFYU01000678.1.p1 GENE.GFYU01000678.1~~GFYU01000678.1.p1  ORF type:complete len:260 (+),score=75.41 GFYU01000678.1:33-782(+)